MSLEGSLPEKVQGYLEKRSKVNFWRWWKKYWFVLDGKTLLYFKTKEDYERLGRCRGSINMSLAQAVQPSSSARRSYPIEVITRTKTIQLSACDEDNRQKWLSALQNAIRLPEISSPMFERLSSRLSANLSLKRPFSQRSSGYYPDDDADTIKYDVQSVYSRSSSTAEEFRSANSPQVTSSDSSGDTISNENTALASNNDREPLRTTTGRCLSDVTPTDTEHNTENERITETRIKTRSLYEEIVEEVLEITSRKLSGNSMGKDIKGGDNSSKNEEFLKDFTAILQDRKSFPEDTPPPSSPPVKPPRTESLHKRTNNCETEDADILQVPNRSSKAKQETEIENEVYESANESSYVTAESSEYEGDTSSYSSMGSNKGNMNSLNTLTENQNVSASTGSEASMESIKPQTGSLCNMLDVNDGSDSCNSNVPNNDNGSVCEEAFENKSNCLHRRFSLNVMEQLKAEQSSRKHSE